MRHCEEGTARRGNLPLCVECNKRDLFIIHKGRLPRSYFGASKYSLAMTYLLASIAQKSLSGKTGYIYSQEIV